MSGHPWLTDRYSHPSLELSSCVARLDVVRLWDDDVLASVEVGGAITTVLSLLDGRLLIALVEIRDNVCIQLLNAFLQRR